MINENRYVKTRALMEWSAVLKAELTMEITKAQTAIRALCAEMPKHKYPDLRVERSLIEVPPVETPSSEERGDQVMETEAICFDYLLRKEDMTVVARFSDRETAIAFAKHFGLICTVTMPDGQLGEIHNSE